MQGNGLPERLRQARKEAKLSLQQAGELSGHHWMTVWKAEVGRTSPERKTLADLAQVYNKPLEWFYGGEHAPLEIRDAPAVYGEAMGRARLLAEIKGLLDEADDLSVQELERIKEQVELMLRQARRRL